MSIEKLIEENTKALTILTAQIEQLLNKGSVQVTTTMSQDVAKAIAKAETKKSTAGTASPAKDAGQDASEKADNASENEVDYETVKVPFMLWASKDKPAAIALLAKVGAKNLTSATPEQRKAIFAAIPKADEDLA